MDFIHGYRILGLPRDAAPSNIVRRHKDTVLGVAHEVLEHVEVHVYGRVFVPVVDIGVDEARIVLDAVVATEVVEADALATLADEVEAAVSEEPGERVGQMIAFAKGVDEDGRGDAFAVAREVAMISQGVEGGTGRARVARLGGTVVVRVGAGDWAHTMDMEVMRRECRLLRRACRRARNRDPRGRWWTGHAVRRVARTQARSSWGRSGRAL